jgi:hypothetical protein
MKISIGFSLVEGPWGGGNQFGWSMRRYFEERGHEVYFDLKPPDLDIIVLTEPRAELSSSAYTDREIRRYLTSRNPNALVVHRMNESDQRKGTRGVNDKLRRANRCADHTVFVSSSLRDLYFAEGLSCSRASLILNGADTEVFFPKSSVHDQTHDTFKLVTHHWGNSWNKGFAIYKRLDELLGSEYWGSRLDFTYIGQLPKSYKFRYATYVEPLNGQALADLIRLHDIYLTGSLNEPGGMHHIEGALCGLPLLYIDSGAIPEYAKGYGVSFVYENFEEKLEEIITNYRKWLNLMHSYPHSANKMCGEYLYLFETLVRDREEIVSEREKPQSRGLTENISYLVNEVQDSISSRYSRLKRRLRSI